MASGNQVDELTVLRQRLAELEAEIQQHRQDQHHAEQRFRQFAEASPVMIWMSGAEVLCTFVNRAWLEFRGRSLDEETGSGWVEGVHPDDRDLCLETYLKCFSARQRFSLQYRMQKADGTYSWVEHAASPHLDGNGAFAGYIGSAMEVNQRRRALFTPDEEAVQMILKLTERERQILVLISQGMSTKAAAARLGISYKTVDSHRSRILEKLGVHETASMVRCAIRAGLIEP